MSGTQLIFTSDQVAQWWTAHGAAPELLCQVRGVSYWRLSLEKDDERCMDQEYIALAQRDWEKLPEIIWGRLWPPLYAVKREGQVALTIVDEVRLLPIARDPEHLQKIFNEDGAVPKNKMQGVLRLDDVWRILALFEKAKADGATHIMDILSDKHNERLAIDQVIRLMQHNVKTGKDKKI